MHVSACVPLFLVTGDGSQIGHIASFPEIFLQPLVVVSGASQALSRWELLSGSLLWLTLQMGKLRLRDLGTAGVLRMAEHTSYLRFLVCVWTHTYMGIDSGLRSEAIRLGGKVFGFCGTFLLHSAVLPSWSAEQGQ